MSKDIPRIVETIAAISVTKRENRELEERQRRDAEERERQRIEAERQRILEKARVDALDQLTSEQNEVRRLATFIELLEQSPSLPPQTAALLAWARERHSRKLDALSPDRLEQRLTDAKLFEFDDNRTACSGAFSF